MPHRKKQPKDREIEISPEMVERARTVLMESGLLSEGTEHSSQFAPSPHDDLVRDLARDVLAASLARQSD